MRPSASTVPAPDLADPVWTVEEVSGEPERVPLRARDRAWPLVIAGAVAVVGFAFAGGVLSPTRHEGGNSAARNAAAGEAASRVAPTSVPAPTSTAVPLELVVPADGERVVGGTVAVRGHAAPVTRTVHVAIRLGSAVLGWVNLDVNRDGSFTGTVRVFAPAAAIPVQVGVSAAIDGRAVETSRAITLDGGAAVVLWSAEIDAGPGEHRVVRLDGVAPLTVATISVWVTDTSGRRVGWAEVRNGSDPGRAGSVGGRDIGLGSFRGRIVIDDDARGTLAWHASWTDAVDGSTGSLEGAIPSAAIVKSGADTRI